MAHTNVSNTFVGVPKVTGGIFRYPLTASLPTNAYAARPVGGARLGGASDDGITWMSTRDTEQKFDWNGDKVRKIQSSKDDKFQITYVEFLNPETIAEVFGTANVTVAPSTSSHGTLITAKSNAEVLGHHAYIVDTFDGTVKKRRVIPDAEVAEIDDVAEKPGDWSVYTVTYDMFPDSQGNTSYVYYELGDVWVPTDWEATITGISGTVTYTVVLGEETDNVSDVAYNATTTVLETALEGLDTVGEGNVTVGGSVGAYTVTLARGGTLSATGTAGATASVQQM